MMKWNDADKESSCPDPNLASLYELWVTATEAWVYARWDSGASLKEDMGSCLLDAAARVMKTVREKHAARIPPQNTRPTPLAVFAKSISPFISAPSLRACPAISMGFRIKRGMTVFISAPSLRACPVIAGLPRNLKRFSSLPKAFQNNII